MRPWYTLSDLTWRIEQLPSASRELARTVHNECLRGMRNMGWAILIGCLTPNLGHMLVSLFTLSTTATMMLAVTVINGGLESAIKSSETAHRQAAEYATYRRQSIVVAVVIVVITALLLPFGPFKHLELNTVVLLSLLKLALCSGYLMGEGHALTRGYAILLTLLRGTPGRKRAPLKLPRPQLTPPAPPT